MGSPGIASTRAGRCRSPSLSSAICRATFPGPDSTFAKPQNWLELPLVMPASPSTIEPRPAAVRAARRSVPPLGPGRSWPVLTVFACIVALQLGVAVISIDVMSAVRAYVTGESLYSKGQKDAHIRLIDYAELPPRGRLPGVPARARLPDRRSRRARGHAEPRDPGRRRAPRPDRGRHRCRRRARRDPPLRLVPQDAADGRRDRDVDRGRSPHRADPRHRRARPRPRRRRATSTRPR